MLYAGRNKNGTHTVRSKHGHVFLIIHKNNLDRDDSYWVDGLLMQIGFTHDDYCIVMEVKKRNSLKYIAIIDVQSRKEIIATAWPMVLE